MDDQHNNVFPFLSLPAELREKIYHHLLVRQRILISYNQTIPSKDLSEQQKTPKGLVAITHNNNNSTIRRRRSVTFELPTPYASPTGLSILFTCRQIHMEASYTLYTKNTFDFTTMPSVKPFLGLIGPRNRNLLTRLRLSSWNRFGFTPALNALRDLIPNARSLEIGVWKFDTFQGQWEGFLYEVAEGLGEEMVRKLGFFAAGGEVWRKGGDRVLGSRDIEGEGMRELERVVEERPLAAEQGLILRGCGFQSDFDVGHSAIPWTQA